MRNHYHIIGIIFLTMVQLMWSSSSFADTERPDVAITAPAHIETVSDHVLISAAASDDVGVTKVTFAIDGVWVGRDTTAPYTFNWDSARHADGIAEVRATAFDAAGNTSRYTRYVRVNNLGAATGENLGPDTEAPSVVITGPGDGETVSGTVLISAAASDDVGVARVAFAIDGVWAGRDTTAPYTLNWDSTTYADGIVKLQATAFDVAGSTSRYTRYITVNNQGPDTEAPGVVITGPSDGEMVSGTVKVSATAWDNVGVSKVTFAIDGVWVERVTTAPYTFNWDTSAHADGITQVRATAFDAAGNTSKYTFYVTVGNQGSTGSVAGFQCYGCDETNIQEIDTINRYDNADGLHKASHLWRIPLLEEDYIPQGIHVTEDGFVYMSMYHKDKDSASYNPTVVVKYSTVTNAVTDVYHLKNSNNSKYMGHAGGLVVSGDYLIVPDGRALKYFRQSDATPATGIESEIKLAFTTGMDFGGSEYNYKMSFLSTTKDHLNQDILWTGQFSTGTTVGSHVLGYKIESDGVVNRVPIYRFYVPETVNKLQGVTVLKATHDAYTLLLSRSYGNNTSYVYKLNYDRQEGLAYKYDYNSRSIAFEGPAGLEDLHATADGIWTLSESGANYYQNRDSGPWSQLFPFIIKLRKSDM